MQSNTSVKMARTFSPSGMSDLDPGHRFGQVQPVPHHHDLLGDVLHDGPDRHAVLEDQDHVLAVRHKRQLVAVEAVHQRHEVGLEVAAAATRPAPARTARSARTPWVCPRHRRAAARPWWPAAGRPRAAAAGFPATARTASSGTASPWRTLPRSSRCGSRWPPFRGSWRARGSAGPRRRRSGPGASH